MKKLFFSKKIFPETFLGKSRTEWWQTCPEQFPQNPKFFPSMPGNILQKKSFLIQKFSPKTFLWTRRIEFLETRQSFFSRKCKLFRSKSGNNCKKTPFSETLESFCFSSQSTSGHIGCVLDGPAEQSRTKFWTFFAQCLKRFMKVGNFVKQKFFFQKNHLDTNSQIPKSLLIFFAKTPKKLTVGGQKVFLVISFVWKKFFFRHKVPLAEKMQFWRPYRSKYAESLETSLSKSEKKFEKKYWWKIFLSESPRDTWKKMFPTINIFVSKVQTISLKIRID